VGRGGGRDLSLPRPGAEVQWLPALTLREPACYTGAASDDATRPRSARTRFRGEL